MESRTSTSSTPASPIVTKNDSEEEKKADQAIVELSKDSSGDPVRQDKVSESEKEGDILIIDNMSEPTNENTTTELSESKKPKITKLKTVKDDTQSTESSDEATKKSIDKKEEKHNKSPTTKIGQQVKHHQEQLELKEAMAQLTQAINKNPNLSKAQEEFFRDMAKTSKTESSNPNTSSSTTTTSSSINNSIKSIHKAMQFLNENAEEDNVKETNKPNVTEPNRDTSFHKSLWQAHEKGIVIKKLLEFAKEKKNQNDMVEKLEKPKFRRTISLPVNKKTTTAHSIMRQQSLSSKQKIIDELLTPRKSNVHYQVKKPNEQDDSANLNLKPSVLESNLLHLPDFEMNSIHSKASFPKLKKEEPPAPLYVLPSYSTRRNNIEQKKEFLPDEEDKVAPNEPNNETSKEEIEVQHEEKVASKKKNKSKQKLYVSDRLSTDNVQIQYRPEGVKRNRSFSSLPHQQPLIRETSITGNNIGITGFETIINQQSFTRSMSFDNASSICTNDTDYTNDSLSSLYHLFSTLKQTETKRVNSISSYPSLHRCDANDESSIITSSEHNSSNAVISPDDSINMPPMFYRPGNNHNYNYHEAFMNTNAVLADDLLTVDDTVDDNNCNETNTELNNAFINTDNDGDTTPETTQTSDVNNVTPDGTDISLSPARRRKDESQRDDDDQQLSMSCSWSINTDDISHFEFDAWDIFHDEYLQNEKDELTFAILGTSADDSSAQPHVLSPPLMDSLKEFLPDRVSQCNYWLKYSLVRDGANMRTLLRNIRTSYNTLFAIETTTGDVFGWFTTSPYKYHYGYFGQGGESFVWKMKYSRCNPTYSLLEQIYMESDIEVYTYTNHNDMIQVCKHDLIAIGGGTLKEVHAVPDDMNRDIVNSTIRSAAKKKKEKDKPKEKTAGPMGFAIALTQDLLRGTTSACATYDCPNLMNGSCELGSVFDVLNIEVWTFTPCVTEEQAERNELNIAFRDDHPDLNLVGIFVGAK